MRAFEAALKPSRRLLWATVLLHFCTMVVCIVYFYGIMRTAGLILLTISLMWALWRQWQKPARSVRKIMISRQGEAALLLGEEQVGLAAKLCAGSLVSRWGLFLKWDLGDGFLYHCVLPDMASAEAYRRLQVWAQWGQVREKKI